MDPRTKRKQREYEARRQEILSAAECLFSKNGFFKTSMAEIATASQFAMGTVYRFFLRPAILPSPQSNIFFSSDSL